MAYVEIPANYLLFNANWNPSTGSYSGGNNFTNYPLCVHAHGSSDYLSNFVGFTNSAQWQVFTVLTVIPFGSTINSVHFLAWFDAAVPNLHLDIQYDPPFGPSSGTVNSIGGPQLIDLDLAGQSFNRFDLANGILQTDAASNISTACHLDYVAFAIDYTPPADGLVTVYVAGAYPLDCPQPSAKKFKHFGIFDTAAGLEQQVTAAWMRKYGKPPAGYQLWNYYRASSYGFHLGAPSPVTAWFLDPWPPPN